MPVQPLRHVLLRSRLGRFDKAVEGVDAGDVKAIHRTRVASRRLRELLPVLQGEPELVRKLERRLRTATRQLGEIREIDVLLALAEELQDTRRYSERAVRHLVTAIRHDRDEVRRRFANRAPGRGLRRIGRQLDELAQALEAPEKAESRRAWRWALDARVARRATALQEAIDHAGTIYLQDRLHDVRIALKKLRYALELTTEADKEADKKDEGGRRSNTDLTTLRRLQRLLGRLHDLQVLVDRVRRVQAEGDVPDINVWRDLDALAIGLDQSGRRLHARYTRERGQLMAMCGRLTARGARPSPRKRAVAR